MSDRDSLLADVGDELLQHRSRQGWNLEEAAAHARIDPERLADAESGTVALNSDELDRIAGSYGVDVTSFFGGRTTPLSYLFGA